MLWPLPLAGYFCAPPHAPACHPHPTYCHRIFASMVLSVCPSCPLKLRVSWGQLKLNSNLIVVCIWPCRGLYSLQALAPPRGLARGATLVHLIERVGVGWAFQASFLPESGTSAAGAERLAAGAANGNSSLNVVFYTPVTDIAGGVRCRYCTEYYSPVRSHCIDGCCIHRHGV